MYCDTRMEIFLICTRTKLRTFPVAVFCICPCAYANITFGEKNDHLKVKIHDPFEKEDIVLHLSVNWMVGRSVDQAMSIQYLLTILLESCQTWYSGWP